MEKECGRWIFTYHNLASHTIKEGGPIKIIRKQKGIQHGDQLSKSYQLLVLETMELRG